MEKIQFVLLAFIPLLFSLSFHEAAHAWMADRLGDPTAKFLGRLTINPLPHIDPIGTVVLPIFFMLTGGGSVFGWAKPVPVNSRNLKGKYGELLVAAAGPISNLILAATFTFIFYLLNHFDRPLAQVSAQASMSLFQPLLYMLAIAIQLNVLLAFFNFVPLPPLDGSRVLVGLFPQLSEHFRAIERYGFILLFALLYLRVLDSIVFVPASRVSAILLHLAAS